MAWLLRLPKSLHSLWRDLPLGWKGGAVVLLPLTAVAIVLAAGYFVHAEHRAGRRWVEQTFTVRLAIQPIYDAATDAETVVRGFQLTGDNEFLQIFEQSRTELAEAIERITGLLNGDAPQLARLAAIEQVAEERMQLLLEQTKLGPVDQARQPQMVERALRGKDLMKKLRRDVVSMEEAERQHLAERLKKLDALDVRMGRLHLFSAFLGLVGGVAASRLFSSGIAERIRALKANANRLAQGGTLERAEASRDEIGELENALETASALLVERNRALHENQHLLEGIIEGTTDLVFAMDLEGKFLLVNEAVGRVFGKRPEELRAMNFKDVFGAAAARIASESNAKVLQSGQVQTFEETMPWPAGTATVLVTKGILRGDAGKAVGIVGIARDITDRKRMEERLASSQCEAERARADAERANLAKSEFLSRMSHELRTPLNAILGFGQLLEMDPLEEEQLQSVGMVLKGGRHLLDLINEVLDLARIEAGRIELSPEPVPIVEVLQEAVALIRSLASARRISVNASPSIDHCTDRYVRADQQRLKQVVLNLLSNAVKYNRDGGSVTIDCQILGGTERLRVTVQDTGPGIPPAKMGRLFTPFDRLGAEQSPVEGTGLGLALSRNLVEAMRGAMGATSVVGEGSAFWFELPLTHSPLETCVQQPPEALPEAPRSVIERTVLLIEDNLSNLELIQRILKNRPNIKLLSAMQATIGLDLARRQRPDLILLDLHLPDLHGYEVLHRLKAEEALRDIPVVVISADATQGQIARLKEAGARAYLTKPLDLKEFFKTLQEHLHSSE